jgi:hypothetical protein
VETVIGFGRSCDVAGVVWSRGQAISVDQETEVRWPDISFYDWPYIDIQ